MSPHVHHLSLVRLPEGGPERRYTRPPARQTEAYRAAYDRRTLIYEAWAADGRLNLICPRLLNLWPVVRSGLEAAGAPLRLRRRRFLRYEWLSTPLPDDPVFLRHGAWSAPVVPTPDARARFAGRNLLIAVSRNNDPDWIATWAKAHVTGQGTDAVILIDNGSDRYAPEAVSATLSEVAGLNDHLVLSAPAPYGPPGGTAKLEVPPRFFQTAMLNLVRLHYAARARGVLSLDIDEIMRPGPVSIYDMAARSRSGQVAFRGRWCYAATEWPAPQQAHDLTVPGQKPCMPKWCVVPQSISGRFDWTVHRLGGPLHQISQRRAPMFWHCFQTSTSWKKDRSLAPDGARPDPELAADWPRLLPGARGHIG
ncbi:MAG: hypothetical protein RI553_08085 [Salibaculum sp.]|uniref:hypothetical protein n=1 Tax=Salibaculum sp. TaxID=2855480 RepID=UPI0028707D6D|nr:hypothetical protein [Salibaculum sp.]MDR9428050.1 hypothetical protein [Salibaculum sp.]